MTLKHTTLTVAADDPNYDVSADEWNEDHTISGTSLALQYNNAGSLSEMSGTSWDNTNRALTLTGATVTTSKPILDLSQTWNAGAVTFTGLKFNITNTASASTSRVFDFQIGGSSFFYVGSPDGNIVISQLTAAVASAALAVKWTTNNLFTITHSSGANTGVANIYNPAGNGITFQNVRSLINFGAGAAYLSDEAAGALALKIGATATVFRVYNTTDNNSGAPTNYERGVFDWTTTANTLTIGTQANGTGTLRAVAFVGASFSFNSTVRLQGYTVATLPAAGTAGRRAYVTDATAPAYNAALTGGGAIVVPVFDNGAAWVSA